jgi:4'-phosphopantetheinyl transferase
MRNVDVGEVHIWTIRSSIRAENRSSFERVLSLSERTAANRFHFERHRLSYIFSHAALRHTLSGYVNQTPEGIEFFQNSFGKPFLRDNELQFNMSHSGDVVVIGVTRGRQIGVDVEMVRPIKDFSSIARLNFTKQECELIEATPTASQQYVFFRSWARKEAVIKAVGKGLSIPLNTFDASIPADENGQRLGRFADAPDIDAWWLSDLTVPEGYVGAVVLEQSLERLSYQAWESSQL